MQHLVAEAGIGADQQGDDLIRPRAADDTAGVQPEALADGGPQFVRAAVRIEMQPARFPLVGLHGQWTGAQRSFIGGQHDYLFHAVDRVQTADIRFDIHDAGFRCRLRHLYSPLAAVGSNAGSPIGVA